MDLKGIALTLDALIAMLLVVSVISLLVFFRTESISPFFESQQLHALSEDVLTILSESTLKEVVSEDLINQYLANGVLNENDLNKKAIDVIGALWAAGNVSEAANISKDILNDLLPDNIGYQVLINNDNVYNSSDTNRPSYEDATTEISSARVASGYEKYKPVTGYVARALARAVKKNNTLVVMGDVISSSVEKPTGGNNQNEVNISYIIDIPSDATILDASWFIEAAWVDNKFKAYMNGVYIPGSDGTGSKLLTDIKNYLHPGRNVGNVVYRFGAGGDTGGDDGATHIIVIYNTTQLSTLERFDKQYFQTVISNASIEYKKPIFVLGDIYNISVRFNLSSSTQVKNVTLKFMWNGQLYNISTKNVINGIAEWSDTEIRNALNSNGISYNILSGRFFWFIAHIDKYNKNENLGYERRIVGEDSYIYINYSEIGEIYNYIDITRVLSNFSYSTPAGISGFYRYIRWNFNLTNKIPLLAKWQYAWLYSDGSDPRQLAKANNIILYNHDPTNSSSDPLIVEFARFGYSTNPEGILISGNNKFELNFSTGYAINPDNSLGESTFLIPASVSYDGIFENQTDAENDANQRLRSLLGEDISATEIINQSYSVASVPYMWGPVSVRIRLWV
ncbi:MAG: hypothetical protein QXD43_01160 [Candidatus Aenigmatarchaeota archaeon]